MRRLFGTLRGIVDKKHETPTQQRVVDPALPGFDNRVEVLCSYAERAAAYEDDLKENFQRIDIQIEQLEQGMEAALDHGQDRDALEYIRLAARIRPQRDMLERELRIFQAISTELILRVDTLMKNIDEARELARNGEISPAATQMLDGIMTKLTRYFVMLERVSTARRRTLPDRLAEKMMIVIDDRQLDLELATYILQRRRMLGAGK